MKKRILSLLLVFVLVIGICLPQAYATNSGDIPAEQTVDTCQICQLTDCSGHVYCEQCQIYDCGFDHTAPAAEEVCPDCGKTPCECESEEVCPDCGKTPCECSPEGELPVWDTVAEATDICMIGYLDKSCSEIIFYNNFHEKKSVAASACPEYLILTQSYPHKDTGVDTIYKADSLDDNFYFGTLSSSPFVEAKYFSQVRPAAGLYTKLSADQPLTLYKDLSAPADNVSVTAGELAGEYTVADFCYSDSLFSWFIKLTPDENWPENAENYLWISAASISSLSRTASPKPESHDCSCGAEGDVQFHNPECALYKFWIMTYGEDMTVEELSSKWKELDKNTRESILAIFLLSMPEKLEELKPLLPDMNRRVENSIGGVNVTLFGDIPEDVALKLATVTEESYNQSILNYIPDMNSVIFALDITPSYADGKPWQPYTNENVTVTLKAETLNLSDGDYVRLLHEHEGKIEDLGSARVADGQLSFEMGKFSVVYVTRANAVAQNALNNMVYLDLNAGEIVITATSYSGFRFDGGDTPLAVTGTLGKGESYYIYQSNDANKSQTGIIVNSETNTPEIKLPSYVRVPGWADKITKNFDVENVITLWNTLAPETGRSSTTHHIDITGLVYANMYLDDLWSTYVVYGQGSKTAALMFRPGGPAKLNLYLIGDNRLSRIQFDGEVNAGSEISVNNADTENPGTLTLCNPDNDQNMCYWRSAFGSDDGSSGAADGIVINSGIIFAGTNAEDDCTAIGGGGNGYGGVTINGGTVTAVCSSSGAAIGGGIGKTSVGGQADVVINGGNVNAKNYSCSSRNYSQTGETYIPAAAIGGGSSAQQTCNNSTVTITGGNVYARSIGGTAIGGGSSSDKAGGTSTINISGGFLNAASLAGDVAGNAVKAGVAIGGGTGGNKGDGGNCVLNVSGGTIITGSIGGGKTLGEENNMKIGSATVNITGGNITGQVIMAKGAATDCSFNMRDGVIDNLAFANAVPNDDGDLVSGDYTFLEENGGAVYVENGKAVLSGGAVKNVHATKGGAFYVSGGEFEMNGGTIESAHAASTGGAVCVEKDGDKTGKASISDNAVIKNVYAAHGGAVAVNGGEFNMRGGEISGVKASSNGSSIDGNGGAVYVQSGTVTISNGSITGHDTDIEAKNGGGVYIEGGEFNMSGGSMTNFNVSDNGGMVCVTGDGAKATVQGGTISGNTAQNVNEAAKGGAVYISAGEFKIDGEATIKDCNATVSGGGVYMESGSFEVAGGSFVSCIAAVDGGGIYLGNGSFTMPGGKFEKCVAGNFGGAVCIMNGNANIKGGQILGDNTSVENEITANIPEAQYGGGIYVGGGELNMEKGEISCCSAQHGGAAYISGGICNISGGKVSYNYAEDGGGFYVLNTPVNYGGFSELKVEYNEALHNGGGMYIRQAEGTNLITEITSGNIDNNKAGDFGGGIYHIGDKGSCTITGSSSIAGNTAQNGGGLYIVGGSILTVGGGHIHDNSAVGKPAEGVKTAYDHEANIGVGGGVYVGPGTTVRSNFTMSGEAVGIYSNTAEFAADDVYANAKATVLSLPAVDKMQISESLSATGWYCDYPTGDTQYNQGLLKGLYFTGSDRVQRYRIAAVSADTSHYKVTDSLNMIEDKYICLTIGTDIINYGTITISKSGCNDIDEDQYFVFKVKADSVISNVLEEVEFEVTVKGNGSVTIKNVPYGSYTVTELTDWSWRYDAENSELTAAVGAESKDAQFSFVNTRAETLWLDGNSEAKLNIRGSGSAKLLNRLFN